jgi:hypothetical protein
MLLFIACMILGFALSFIIDDDFGTPYMILDVPIGKIIPLPRTANG